MDARRALLRVALLRVFETPQPHAFSGCRDVARELRLDIVEVEREFSKLLNARTIAYDSREGYHTCSPSA